jgi:hypothetical protein
VAKSRGARIAVGSRSWEDRWIRNPIAFRVFGGSEVERSYFRLQSREVPRAEARRDTWQNHKVGPGSRPVDTRHTFGGVNTPLTSRVSGTREIRERKFEPSTREVASSENERRKVNIASRGFGKERCQGWTFELAKAREARSASA